MFDFVIKRAYIYSTGCVCSISWKKSHFNTFGTAWRGMDSKRTWKIPCNQIFFRFPFENHFWNQCIVLMNNNPQPMSEWEREKETRPERIWMNELTMELNRAKFSFPCNANMHSVQYSMRTQLYLNSRKNPQKCSKQTKETKQKPEKRNQLCTHDDDNDDCEGNKTKKGAMNLPAHKWFPP